MQGQTEAVMSWTRQGAAHNYRSIDSFKTIATMQGQTEAVMSWTRFEKIDEIYWPFWLELKDYSLGYLGDRCRYIYYL